MNFSPPVFSICTHSHSLIIYLYSDIGNRKSKRLMVEYGHEGKYSTLAKIPPSQCQWDDLSGRHRNQDVRFCLDPYTTL